MFFNIDPSNGLAIYDQIVRQVKFAVAADALRAGELVPSVRELARELAVNPNTVSRAYGVLQAENILASVRGTGMEVTTDAPGQCRKDRLRLIGERLHSVLQEARFGGLNRNEISSLIEKELSRLDA